MKKRSITPARNSLRGISFPTIIAGSPALVSLQLRQSGFYIAHLNADSAELSGRITTAEGYSKRFVTVNLTNSGGTITRTAKTNAKGFYRFSDLPTGETYTVTPSFYTVNFTPSNQTFLFTGGRTNVNFIFRRE